MRNFERAIGNCTSCFNGDNLLAIKASVYATGVRNRNNCDVKFPLLTMNAMPAMRFYRDQSCCSILAETIKFSINLFIDHKYERFCYTFKMSEPYCSINLRLLDTGIYQYSR